MNTENRYQFWFDFDGQRVQLPMTPEKITVKNSRKNESFSVADLGEITLFKEKSPEQISFSGIFPGHYFPGCTLPKPKKPYIYTNFFKVCLTKKKAVRFTVTQCKIYSFYTVEEFSFSERGGDAGTVEFSILLKEYREVKIRQISISNKTAKVSPKKTSRVSTKTVPKTYTVKAGDCLWNIAKKFYGDGSKYKKIYDANKKTIGGNPNLIYPGQVLAIP